MPCWYEKSNQTTHNWQCHCFSITLFSVSLPSYPIYQTHFSLINCHIYSVECLWIENANQYGIGKNVSDSFVMRFILRIQHLKCVLINTKTHFALIMSLDGSSVKYIHTMRIWLSYSISHICRPLHRIPIELVHINTHANHMTVTTSGQI